MWCYVLQLRVCDEAIPFLVSARVSTTRSEMQSRRFLLCLLVTASRRAARLGGVGDLSKARLSYLLRLWLPGLQIQTEEAVQQF